jgi:hypothetical protein
MRLLKKEPVSILFLMNPAISIKPMVILLSALKAQTILAREPR